MPFITAAIGAIAGAIGGALSFIGGAIGGLGFFGKALLSIGLNVAVGAIQKAFAPKPKALRLRTVVLVPLSSHWFRACPAGV